MISIHIPSDANLSDDSIRTSLNESKVFLKTYYNIENYKYYCKSWLLSPRLENVLPTDSKILVFQSFFEDYEFYEDDFQCLYWVFGNKG